MDIVDDNINEELVDNDYVGIIRKIKIWIDEEKIIELKEKLTKVSDINEKVKITDEIVKLKNRMCENEES